MQEVFTSRAEIEFDPEDLQKISRLLKRVGLKRKAVLLDNALCALEWAVEQRENGKEVASVDQASQQYEIYSTPVLDRIEQKMRS